MSPSIRPFSFPPKIDPPPHQAVEFPADSVITARVKAALVKGLELKAPDAEGAGCRCQE